MKIYRCSAKGRKAGPIVALIEVRTSVRPVSREFRQRAATLPQGSA